MFGPKLTTVFASRWRAAWFSASVLLTAYCTVPHKDDQESVTSESAAVSQQRAENGGMSDAEKKQIDDMMKALSDVNG
jgi:hypothetical protein